MLQLSVTMMSWVSVSVWLDLKLFTTHFSDKPKRMGIEEILRRIWLISENKLKHFESIWKQASQVKLNLKSSLWQIIVMTIGWPFGKTILIHKTIFTQNGPGWKKLSFWVKIPSCHFAKWSHTSDYCLSLTSDSVNFIEKSDLWCWVWSGFSHTDNISGSHLSQCSQL